MSLIYTARASKNAVVLIDILKLYVPQGARGCDVTYGRGAFWNAESLAHVVELRTSDITEGVCLSSLPYADASQDFHVLDPPYCCGFFRPKASQKALEKHSDFAARYGNHNGTGYKGVFWHSAVEAIYSDGLKEAARVLVPGGVQITKVQDEVSNHKQHLTHCHVVSEGVKFGLEVLDLFVVVRQDKPHGRRIKHQEHARKNHSYFVVFKKCRPRRVDRADGENAVGSGRS
jgi:hypothetical protein